MTPGAPGPSSSWIRALYLQPLPVVLAGFGLGILGSTHSPVPARLLLVFNGLLLWPLVRVARKPAFFVALLFVASALFGAARTKLTLAPEGNHDISKLPAGAELIFEGRIDEVPVLTRYGSRFVVRAERRILGPDESRPLSGLIQIFLPEKLPDLAFGDRLRLSVKLSRPQDYRTPGAFSYSRYLERRNIHVTGAVRDGRHLAVLGDTGKTGLRAWILQIRNRLDAALMRHFPARSAGLAKAFLTGRRDSLSTEEEDVFRKAGVVHILSVSGLHMGVVGLAVYQVLWRLLALLPGLALRISVRKIAALLAIGPTLFYLFLAGAEPPAVRSALLIGLFCLAQVVERPKEPFHALAVSALVMLLASPLLVFDISFQLTFTSVLGLLLAARYFAPPPVTAEGALRRFLKPVRRLVQGLGATAGATLLTAPIVLQAFNLFSPVAILSNLVIAPLSSLAVIVLLLSAPILATDSTAAAALAQPVQILLDTLPWTSRFFADIPGASLWLPEPTPLETILLVAIGGGILLVRTRLGRAALGLSFVSLCLVSGLDFLREHRARSFRAVFLDVGQGDSAWVRLPSGKTMLIDAGGGVYQTFDVGKNVVARYLWLRKRLKVDIVAISHPHPDHADGAKFILEHFRVGEIWTSAEFPGPDGYGADLLEIAERKGIPHRVLKQGDIAWKGPQETIRVLAPTPILTDDVNDNSLVFRIDAGGGSILFPGDIGAHSETRMWLSREHLQADLLKVPHHGSRTSSSEAFLRAVRPKRAVVSVGRNNRYGLPDEEILERIERASAEIWRLDETGAVAFEWKDQKWQRATP